MPRQLLKFTLLLLFCGALTYLIHNYLLELLSPQASRELFLFSYKFNFAFTFLFTTTIIIASQSLKDQLGFIFLASSFIKLAIFLVLVKMADYEMNKSNFLHFFVPYVVCVVLEIIYVSRILKQANYNKDK